MQGSNGCSTCQRLTVTHCGWVVLEWQPHAVALMLLRFVARKPLGVSAAVQGDGSCVRSHRAAHATFTGDLNMDWLLVAERR
jgi:hypothetical protein